MKVIIHIFLFLMYFPLITNGEIQKIGVSLIINPQGEKIFFESSKPSGFALFQQKNTWVIAFDIKDKFDLTSFSSSQLLTNVEIIPSDFAVIRFDLKQGYFPQISQYSKGWVIDLQTTKYSSCKAFKIKGKNNKYLIKTTGIKEKIFFQDPVTGDDMFVYPDKNIGECLNEDHHYMNFSLLKTVQGIVIKSKSDHLNTEYTDQENLSISIPETFVSSVDDKKLYAKNPESMALEFLKKEIDKNAFYNMKQTLMNEISESKEEELIHARLNFAQFLISFALGSEAYDYLDGLKNENPKIEQHTKFIILLGLSALLCNHLEIADKYLSNPVLKESGDAPFYLNISKGLQKVPLKDQDLSGFFKLFSKLPYELKINLGLKTIDVSIQNQLFDTAREAIRLLLKEDLSNEDQDLLYYYQGVLYERDGLLDEAARNFTDLEKTRYPKVYALMRMYLLSKNNDTQEKRTQAAQELEKLRFSLTNSTYEIEILEKIANLYRLNQDWIQALRTLHKIIKYYPKIPEKNNILKTMRDLFLEQYKSAFINSMPIFYILGLFDEFSFLIHQLDDETRIVLELAEICITAGLNQRALKLLNKQLEKSSSTPQKMSILLKIAQIHSKTGKDRDSLKTLQKIQRKELSPQDQKKLDYLMVYTQYALGETTLANQEILPGDDSYEANNFRARVFWSFKDWGRAASSLRRVVELSSNEALSTQYHVIYYAIAVRYTGNFTLLKELREYYLPQLKGSPLQEIFNFVTTLDTSIEGLHFTNIKDIFSEIKTLEKFMEEYKKQQAK